MWTVQDRKKQKQLIGTRKIRIQKSEMDFASWDKKFYSGYHDVDT